MKLRALSLTNVRKFAGKTATLSGIGDGITVVSEANEFGKSTFFDALHALFFERFGATGKPVKALQPHSGGSVRVAVEVETDAGRFVIEKRWLAQKGASVREAASGRLIASDGEAEAWIAGLIGDDRDGPAGLLWVRQGLVGLEPSGNSQADKAEKARLAETRRDLLSSVAGEIDTMTGGQRMDRVLRRCRDELDALTTPTGRPSGAWKAAQDEAKELDQAHAALGAQCVALGDALRERGEVMGEIARLDAPGARARRESDLDGARQAARNAEDHAARVAQAEQALKIAALEHEEAGRERDALTDAARARTEAERARADAARELADAESAAAGAGRERDLARAVHDDARARLNALQAALAGAHRRETAARDAVRARDLAGRLKAAEGHRAEAEKAAALVKANPATPARLAVAEAAEGEVARLRAALAAGRPSLRIDYCGDLRVSMGGSDLPHGRDVALDDDAALDLPGIGRLHIRAGSGRPVDSGRDLDAANAKLTAALSACGAETIQAARQAGEVRTADAARERLAAGRLDAVAPGGLEALRLEAAEAARSATPVDEAPDGRSAAQIEAEMEAAAAPAATAQATFEAAERELSRAREVSAAAVATLAAAERALGTARTAAGTAETMQARLATAAERVEAAARIRERCQAALDELTAAAPDLLTAKANLTRAEAATKAAEARRNRLGERRSALSAEIGAKASQGVEEQRDELAGRLAAATDREARLAAEVAALSRLRQVLEDARSAARDAYFGPVQEELAPLLNILHADAALSFDSDSMLPQALSRGPDEEGLETLSGGTQEQIAILTRLAFARLFARQGRQMPIILDDALVYSDDSRIVKMFTALNRAATDQQIIVFSCRQLAFESLGGERPDIRVSDAQ
ncbi:MAG: AAA family ATPase [Jhaorihella sp.]